MNQAIEQSKKQAVIEICARFGNDRTRLLDILLAVQSRFRCVEPALMASIAEQVGSYRVEVEGMVSFYAFFSTEPLGEVTIRLCDDIIDRHSGVEEIAGVFAESLGVRPGETSADGRFSLLCTPCIGMSDQAPAGLFNGRVITNLTVPFARAIADQLVSGVDPAALELPLGDGNNTHPLIHSMVRNNIRLTGEVLLAGISPEAGLNNALARSPKLVIDEIDRARLTGRGGAGYPTGQKWRIAAETPASQRYIFCNADEGEPGTFKDRVLLTERAGLMIEGMTLAAYAVSAGQGVIYLRNEYAYLREYLQSILDSRRKQGLLGSAIGGHRGFDFDIRIQLGAGAYICGEESALISSCEGLRGEPKTRPPFPVQSGYLGCPTVVDNVETFCCAARILDQGAAWFRSLGTEGSSGTRLLSVSGDCERPGIYELPFGISVKNLLELAGAQDAAAVQIGGASGEMINMSQFGRRICNEDLHTGGSIMVFSARRNILEIVEYFLDFFIDESCGYCTPCRVGNVFLRKRIDKIRQGLCQLEDLDYLRELGRTIAETSRCGLGHTSPNPVLTTLKNFPLVYAALLKKSKDGMQAAFDIQSALEESRHLAKRRSMIYDPTYDDSPRE
ncbi:MAG: NAD(P)H-dependent oxidoreductase subunit E [Gammaproteobacteria bacterium]|nr:NAD(P)H-dependent oxidoreductase subunit E [Gammaproteobacteria bacterium]